MGGSTPGARIFPPKSLKFCMGLFVLDGFCPAGSSGFCLEIPVPAPSWSIFHLTPPPWDYPLLEVTPMEWKGHGALFWEFGDFFDPVFLVTAPHLLRGQGPLCRLVPQYPLMTQSWGVLFGPPGRTIYLPGGPAWNFGSILSY